MSKVQHGGGRVVTLNGPGSQELNLQGTGEVVFAWEPSAIDDQTDPRDDGAIPSQEFDVRARIVDLPPPATIGDIPVIRYRVELSHGDAVWYEPHPPMPIVAGTPIVPFSLPSRGMNWRLPGNKFRIRFFNQSMITGAPLTASKVLVSVTPAFAELTDAVNYQSVGLPTPGQHAFPLEARTFRLVDATGQPFAPAANFVVFTGIMGALFGPVDASLYGSLTPIPHDAIAWICGPSLTYAQYAAGGSG